MKKIILVAAMLFSTLLYKTAEAQVSVSINIGSQPAWGPVGYDYVNYYYMPDIDTYYDVPNHRYVYYQNNVWVHSRALPAAYRNYNVYNGYKVVINERNPWERNAVIRSKYANYKGRHDQVVIRNSKDVKYKEHWKGNNGRGRGNGKPGNGHDNGRGHGNDGHGKGHGGGNGHDKH